MPYNISDQKLSEFRAEQTNIDEFTLTWAIPEWEYDKFSIYIELENGENKFIDINKDITSYTYKIKPSFDLEYNFTLYAKQDEFVSKSLKTKLTSEFNPIEKTNVVKTDYNKYKVSWTTNIDRELDFELYYKSENLIRMMKKMSIG